MGFDVGAFKKVMKNSKKFTDSLIGRENEIIPFEEWDLARYQGITPEHVTHPHTERWTDWLCQNFKPTSRVAVFTLCAVRKPYTTSLSVGDTYFRALAELKDKVDFFIVSSIGIAPIIYEKYYPFAHYSWDGDETPEIKKLYIERNTERLTKFLSTHRYKYCVGHFRPKSESRTSLKNACTSLGIPFLSTPSKEMVYNIKDALSLGPFYLRTKPVRKELHDLVQIALERDLSEEEIKKYQSPTPEELTQKRKELFKLAKEKRLQKVVV